MAFIAHAGQPNNFYVDLNHYKTCTVLPPAGTREVKLGSPNFGPRTELHTGQPGRILIIISRCCIAGIKKFKRKGNYPLAQGWLKKRHFNHSS